MIIAHHSDYEAFEELLSNLVIKLQADSELRTDYYLSRGGVSLEKDVYDFINDSAKKTVFYGNIELVSGQRFPDIVAYVNENEAYGIEVKTTKSNGWKSVGSSIFEGTRVDDVKKIHLLFGKLSDPIEFQCRKYEECLYDVAITHSPRYLIDMETQKDNSIFSKVGVEYDVLRNLKNPFQPIKSYLRNRLKKGDNLWWIDNSSEGVRDLGVRLWGNLQPERKEELRVLALAYFPALLGKDPKKYASLATWLVSQFGIVNYALRDTFTAGGQTTIGGIMFPKIFEYLVEDLDSIVENIGYIESDDMSYYWGIEVPADSLVSPVSLWKRECLFYCRDSLNQEQFDVIEAVLRNIEPINFNQK